LFGFCVHLGGESTDSGHYVVYTKSGVASSDGNERWWSIADEQVEEVKNIDRLLKDCDVRSNVYLLMYKKV